MAVSEGPLWDPFVYIVEDTLAASDVHVFPITFSVTLYFQHITRDIARAGSYICREWRVNVDFP